MNGRILFLALAFGLGETAYFGWHIFPSCDAEMICDGITLLMVALACVVPSDVQRNRPAAGLPDNGPVDGRVGPQREG